MKKRINFVKEKIGAQKVLRKSDPRIASSKYREAGNAAKEKAAQLREFAKSLPEQIRVLEGYGDLLLYTADEIDRFGHNHPASFFQELYQDITPDDVIQTLAAVTPQEKELLNVVTTISGAGTGSFNYFVEGCGKVASPGEQYFDRLPQTFKRLANTDKILGLLRQIDPLLPSTWKSAWDNLHSGRDDSLKNASANARTVIDEISWMPNYLHLKSLPWCRLDNKQEPIRAARCAWIKYGDALPDELKGDPSEDVLWKSFGKAYSVLGKYIHVAPCDATSVAEVETALIGLELGIEEYLMAGTQRLQEVKKNKAAT